jgi:phthiodiolone/phenolphthiodiolone dimycocerosates ketoreductase
MLLSLLRKMDAVSHGHGDLTMELGVLIPAMHHLESVLTDFSTHIDTLNPDIVWMPDRILGNAVHPDLRGFHNLAGVNLDCWLDPFVTLAALHAAAKKPIQFGIAVTDFIRRSPVDLARTAFTLSQVMNAPFNMGFGAGEAENLIPVGYEHGPKPVSQLENGLHAYKAIMDTGISKLANGRTVDLGYHKVPARVWIGGQGPRMLRLTAEYADGWIPAWKMTSDEYAQKREQISAMADRHQRAIPKMAMFASLILGESRKQIFAAMERNPVARLLAISAGGDHWKQWGVEHPAGNQSHGMVDVIVRDLSAPALLRLAPSIPATAIGAVHFVGNAEEVLAELQAYRDAGAEQLVVANASFLVMNHPEEQAAAVHQFAQVCKAVKHWQ